MAKGSKEKKTAKSLTTSKGFKGLENVLDRILAKLPDNVDVDVAKLTQMGLAGTAAYIFADDVAKNTLALSAYLGDITKPEEPPLWFLTSVIGGPVGAAVGAIIEKLMKGLDITPEEQKILDDFKLTEEQKIGLACAVAAFTPEVGAILKGIGEIAPG